MLRRIKPCPTLEGEIAVPGDKSISHRAVILNSLAEGEATINNFCPGDDCLATISCLKALGVKIKKLPSSDSTIKLVVTGTGKEGMKEPENVLNARNSGTTLRLLTGLLSAQSFLSIITGDASLRSRPMKRVIESLRLMGAEVSGRGNDFYAPVAIRGKKLKGITYSLPIPSAQLKSALLLAGLFAHGKTTLEEPIPSRDHTERLLKSMNAEIERQGNKIILSPPSKPLTSLNLHVPGDISSAAYWLVAGAIHPQAKIKIVNCGVNPTRTGIIEVLQAMGAQLKIINQRLEGNEAVADLFIESSQLKGIKIGGEIIPRLIDEIPVLAVAACLAEGNTIIREAAELKVKESDRISATAKELSKLRARVQELPDGMIIYGGSQLHGAPVDSHLDHRLAMALTVAGLVARGETILNRAEVVTISYPTFWDDLKKLMG